MELIEVFYHISWAEDTGITPVKLCICPPSLSAEAAELMHVSAQLFSFYA
jgi:hypothetical protein